MEKVSVGNRKALNGICSSCSVPSMDFLSIAAPRFHALCVLFACAPWAMKSHSSRWDVGKKSLKMAVAEC